MRESDLLNRWETGALKFRELPFSRRIYMPLFLTAGAIETALQFAVEAKNSLSLESSLARHVKFELANPPFPPSPPFPSPPPLFSNLNFVFVG